MDSPTSDPISNLEYDIITTLSNLMQGRDVLKQYASDAEQVGDQDCVELFRTIQANNDDAVNRLRMALSRRLNQS